MTALYAGIATPQANPTVEIEFGRFLSPPIVPLFTRLTSGADAARDRLVDYLEQLDSAVVSFGSLPLSVFAFACTGSCYLVDDERVDALVAAAEQRHRVQVVLATQAIRRELEGRGARRIALLAPYPDDLFAAAVDYWQRLDFEIVARSQIDVGADTRAVYSLTDTDVSEAVDQFDTAGADLLLLSGTGMPTVLSLGSSRIPAVSSNLCLATEVLRRTGQWPANEAADVATLLSKTGP